jgi:ribosomal protein S18 acetylase RimI-like enzyme
MQFEAFFVPPGRPPYDRAILDEDAIRPYHVDFGTRSGDVGRIAVDPSGQPVGAAWVRQVHGYGFVDDRTPELGIAVVAARRGEGIGAALLASLVAAVPRMSLSTDRRNPARRLYERFGFDVVREDGERSLVMLRDGAAG